MLRFVTFWLNWISIEADVILTNRQWRETCEGPQWGWLVWFRKMSEQWGETLAANLPANDPAPPVTSARLGTLKIQTKRLVERIYFKFRDVVMQISVVWACGGSHADWTLWRRVESVVLRSSFHEIKFWFNWCYSSYANRSRSRHCCCFLSVTSLAEVISRIPASEHVITVFSCGNRTRFLSTNT